MTVMLCVCQKEKVEATGKHLQESTEEHEHNTKLASAAHDEFPELTHRQRNNNQIENDVNGG